MPELEIDKKVKPLKPIPKELLSRFYQEIAKKAADNQNCEFQYVQHPNGTNTIAVYTNAKEQSQKIINDINLLIVSEMGPFLERETGLDRSEYFRNITLFESTVEEARISINW